MITFRRKQFNSGAKKNGAKTHKICQKYFTQSFYGSTNMNHFRPVRNKVKKQKPTKKEKVLSDSDVNILFPSPGFCKQISSS